MNTSNAVAIADFDDDGTPDLLVNTQQADLVTLLPGNGDGTFRAPIQLATGKTPFAMAVGNFDTHNLPEVAVLGAADTISVLLNDSGVTALVRTASANGPGQNVGTGLTSNGTRQAFLLAPDETGIHSGVDLGVFSGVSGVETAGVVDTVGTPRALPAPEDTAAPLLMEDLPNTLFVDQDSASGKPEPALSFAADRSLAQQGPEDQMGRRDAIDQLFTELI
jgi:hypothetical protein